MDTAALTLANFSHRYSKGSVTFASQWLSVNDKTTLNETLIL